MGSYQRRSQRGRAPAAWVAGLLMVPLFIVLWQYAVPLALIGAVVALAIVFRKYLFASGEFITVQKKSLNEENDLKGPYAPAATDVLGVSGQAARPHLTLQNLQKMEWLSFELLCKKYLELIGAHVVRTPAGADGGVDLLLFKPGNKQPFALVQCKTRSYQYIGAETVRALYGVMHMDNVSKGMLICNHEFSKTAQRDAKRCQGLHLMDGRELWAKIKDLNDNQRSQLESFLANRDYLTPSCPHCEVKLKSRSAKDGTQFWGCPNYGRRHYSCRYTLAIPKKKNVNTEEQKTDRHSFQYQVAG